MSKLQNLLTLKCFPTKPLETGRELNIHKTFRRITASFHSVLCRFNVRSVSRRIKLRSLNNGNATLLPRTEAALPRCSYKQVFWKYAANLQETAMSKWDFNKVTKQLSLKHSLAWVFSFKFAEYFQNTFS